MRIVNRKTFIALPSGTVYAKCSGIDGLGAIAIKRHSFDNDWDCMEIGTFDDWDETLELFDKVERMKAKGESFPLRLDSIERDGLFESEDDCSFMIYDNTDVKKIIKKLKETLTSKS